MEQNLTSPSSVIAKVMRDFGLPDAGWVNDAYEWIGDVLGIIGVGVLFEDISCAYETLDNRAALPNGMYELQSVELDGSKVDKIAPTHGPKSDFNDKNLVYADLRYYLMGGVVYFTDDIADGTTGYFHYKSFALDEKGLPMVPKDQFFQNAASWYIMRQYLLQGNTHPIIKFGDANLQWEKMYPRAQNSLIFPAIDDMEKFKNAWTQLIPNLHRNFDNFRDISSRGNSYPDSNNIY